MVNPLRLWILLLILVIIMPLILRIKTLLAKNHVCDLYQRSFSIISDFRVCDSRTIDGLHQTYCMQLHVYGCELLNLSLHSVIILLPHGAKQIAYYEHDSVKVNSIEVD